MTPYQLSLFVKAYNERKKAEDEEKLILTYLGAYWNRVKRMPSLNQVLSKEQQQKKMAPEDILEQVKKMNQKLGGTTY